MITKQAIKAMDDDAFFALYAEMGKEHQERMWRMQNKAWDEVKRTVLHYIEKFGSINVSKTYGSSYITLDKSTYFPENTPGEIMDCVEE